MATPSKIGRYEILEELGRGAMGTVYRAKDPAMDRVVALKTIISVALASDQESEFRERFYREARAAGGLAHPGIVPVFDMGEHEGVPFLVMEFISGRTLDAVVKKGERLSLERACEIGQRIAEALGYAHQRGVVHRDIKPANILLTSREAYGIERPKITDFGVAKLAEGRTTLTGQLLGTPAFMPPEQFTGGPIDGRADIFSLGVVLYWMATGEQAFPGESITAVSYKVVHTDPVPPRKLNPWLPVKLDSVIMKCLAKSPDERYQTAEELAHDLAEIREKGKVGSSRMPASAAEEGPALVDPNAPTIGPATMAAAPAAVPAVAVQSPAAVVGPIAAANAAPQAARKSTRTGLIVLAAVVAAALVAGGWYVFRVREKSTVPAAASPAPAPSNTPAPVDSNKVPPSADVPAASEKVAVSAPPVPEPPRSNKEPLITASAGNGPARKPDPAVKAKVSGSPSPKAPVAAPEPAPATLGFDPKALDPKENARLKIDTKRMPGGVDFTVEMNGKLYFHKTSAGSDAPDDEMFVPPGVQEFRVTAKQGSAKKASNTVSAEFKAKKKITMRIELRNAGMASDTGVPQGIYPDTQIVVTLK
ncbi:MAG TPA: serine/threonine-protein kinase [Candidatus Angelobacter sp.]